jgi:hypothetical protein
VNDKKLWYGKVFDVFKNENGEDRIEIHCGLKPMECECICDCGTNDIGNGVYLSRKEAKETLKDN